MARDAAATRQSLMDAAEELVNRQGFSATSIDAVIDKAGVTKGAFFHHFKSKADLGLALVERFANRDAKILDQFLTRAERLSRDPLQQVLLFAALIEEELARIGRPHPGCLFATCCFEAGLFEAPIHSVIRKGFQLWRDRLGERIEAAMRLYPPRIEVSSRELADMVSALFEGGLVLSRGLDEFRVHIEQLRQYRNYLELLFGAIPARAETRKLVESEGV